MKNRFTPTELLLRDPAYPVENGVHYKHTDPTMLLMYTRTYM